MDWSQATAASLYGVRQPPAGDRPAGDVLPLTSNMAGDKAMVPWHPHSPWFWLAAVAGATLLGIAGAEFGVRVGPARAGAALGKA